MQKAGAPDAEIRRKEGSEVILLTDSNRDRYPEPSGKYRQQDLLNTLAYTLSELRAEGVEVDLTRDREGWIGIYVRAFLCPKCGRMTANSEECSQKLVHEGKI